MFAKEWLVGLWDINDQFGMSILRHRLFVNIESHPGGPQVLYWLAIIRCCEASVLVRSIAWSWLPLWWEDTVFGPSPCRGQCDLQWANEDSKGQLWPISLPFNCTAAASSRLQVEQFIFINTASMSMPNISTVKEVELVHLHWSGQRSIAEADFVLHRLVHSTIKRNCFLFTLADLSRVKEIVMTVNHLILTSPGSWALFSYLCSYPRAWNGENFWFIWLSILQILLWLLLFKFFHSKIETLREAGFLYTLSS